MKDGVIYRNDRDAGGHGGMRGAACPAGGGLQHLRGELVTIDTPQSVEFYTEKRNCGEHERSVRDGVRG